MATIAVVGAGIVGLAVGAQLARRGDDVVVLEKEDRLTAHQTGRNSGVIHSGLYYRPGSLKATMSVAGSRSMFDYAMQQGVAVERCGKLVVATTQAQVERLKALAERGRANGLEVQLLDSVEAKQHEPHVQCLMALWVPSTGIIDYPGVSAAMAAEIVAAGGQVRTSSPVGELNSRSDGVVVRIPGEDLRVDAVVACAGLHADRLALSAGIDPGARIIPFRGEYFHLAASKASLVRGLIYPVPDPSLPFLGVHLTRTVAGDVHVGPNAVLALAREGYRRRDVAWRDVRSMMGWPGMWRLGRSYVGVGAKEMARSASKRLFARDLSQLVPGITAADLVPSPAGVRAQAVARDGSMVDDFLIRTAPRQVHVINAPSPAATCALEIARHVELALDRTLA